MEQPRKGRHVAVKPLAGIQQNGFARQRLVRMEKNRSGDRRGQDVDVDSIAFRGGDESRSSGKSGPRRDTDERFLHGPIPAAHARQQVQRLLGEFAIGIGPHIQQIVAALGESLVHGANQDLGQEVVFVAPVAPTLVANGFAGLGWTFENGGRVQRGVEVALWRTVVAFVKAAVVQNGFGLQRTDPLANRGIAEFHGIGVEPDAMNFAVIRA